MLRWGTSRGHAGGGWNGVCADSRPSTSSGAQIGGRCRWRTPMRHEIRGVLAGTLMAVLAGTAAVVLHSGQQRQSTAPPAPTATVTPATTATVVPSPTPPAAPDGATTPHRRTVYSLHMTSDTVGWLVRSDGLWRTVDGARTWQKVLTPSAGSEWAFEFERGSAAYYGQTDAWVAIPHNLGSEVYYTTDGGRTWSHAPLDLSGAVHLDFINSMTGWALVHSNAATGGQEIVEVFNTRDGGRRWHLLATTGVPPEKGTIPLCCIKSEIVFQNARTGWITGTSPEVAGALLYVTHDGGRTWVIEPAFPPAGLVPNVPLRESSPRLPSFFGSIGVLPLLDRGSAAQDPLTVIFYETANGGSTWKATRPVVAPSPQARLVWSVVSPSIFVVSDGTELYRTVDGARAWNKIPLSPPLEGLQALDFVSATFGFAVVHGGLYDSTDGGRTWTALPAAR